MPRIMAKDKLTGIAKVKERKKGREGKIRNTFRDKIKRRTFYFLKGLAAKSQSNKSLTLVM